MTTPSHRQIWSGLATQSDAAPVGILGIPFDSATSFRRGAALAPERIRSITPHSAPFTEEGQSLQAISIYDYGDVAPDLSWIRYFDTVRQKALQVLSHDFSIFIGGDHSVTIPLVEAFSDHNSSHFGIIHIDSHTDLMDSFDGSRWSHACTGRRNLEYSNIAPEHYAFIAIRSWLQEELDFLKANPGIQVHTARAVYREGVGKIAEQVIQQFDGVGRIYLTLDIDCLDPAYAPGTGTPEAGGLSTREILELLRLLIEALPVQAMDIVEVSPPLDSADITSIAAIKIIYEMLGFLYYTNSSTLS